MARLSDRGLLRVAGADAARFLQGLVTNDLEAASGGTAIHAALLTPQGKILFDFFIVEARGGYLLDCARDQAQPLLKRLTFYKLRAAVDLLDLSDEHDVWAVWDGEVDTSAAIAAFPDPRLAALGWRLVLPHGTRLPGAECEEASEADYHAHRIALGVPEGGRDYAFGDAFPHEADFDQLHGIDFHKGCFVGQEVVSRMHHRGTARKRIVPLVADGPLDSGAAILADTTPIGTVGSTAGTLALAMVRLDRAESALAEGKPLTAGGVPVRLRQPEWAGFKVPA